MRFLVVFCLIGAACAQYKYNQGESYEVSSSNNAPSYASQNFGSSYQGSSNVPSYASPSGSASSQSNNYAAPAQLEKEYYSFSADEDDFIEPAASEQVASNAKKSLRVVFIKGPENRGLEDAALALAKQASEQQTAIYVLNKQADIGDLSNKLNAIRNNQNNKPEVHFVKYRTPEDAANAQRTIQSQYDQLGGSSQSFNGGVAPSINFASRQSAPQPQIAAAPSSPSSSYLPANILRRLRLRI